MKEILKHLAPIKRLCSLFNLITDTKEKILHSYSFDFEFQLELEQSQVFCLNEKPVNLIYYSKNKMKRCISIVFILTGFISSIYGQNYTSYITGNTSDLNVIPSGGICLMGGATENDSAMVWFLRRANGGDILVLRTSGSNGYNNYMYSGLGVNVNSVETIVFHNSSAAYEPYIHQKIQQAEAIWFAGGDQWNYISYWKNTPIDSLINDAIAN